VGNVLKPRPSERLLEKLRGCIYQTPLKEPQLSEIIAKAKLMASL
jgi:hypothetical protein